MNILIACEYSGRVREAFAARGHNVMSCDLRETEQPGIHYRGDVRDVLYAGCWDMMIAHPYCTYNCLSGIRWMYHPEDTHLPATERRRHPAYPDRMINFEKGVEFFNMLKEAPIPMICLENSLPHGLAMSRIGKYSQVLQPWHVGSPFTKAAALWLKGLPKIEHTHRKEDYEVITAACHSVGPGLERERERSRTDTAIAAAFARQWG